MSLQKIPGFESTAYASQGGRVVWAGGPGTTDHPRHATAPWQPVPQALDAARLQVGVGLCLQLFGSGDTSRLPAKGLMLWLTGQPMQFPMNHAVARFDAVRAALAQRDLYAFEAAALRVLGLGHGLTPSGDDFVGGILFALAHLQGMAPGEAWLARLPGAARQISQAAQTATNMISAALLDDLIAGRSYRVLHELLAALDTQDAPTIEAATVRLLALGATSGADMLAGVLLALTGMRLHH